MPPFDAFCSYTVLYVKNKSWTPTGGALAAGEVLELVQTPWAQHLAQASSRQLRCYLVNDAYKPRMHLLYSGLLSALEVDEVLVIIIRLASDTREW